MDSHQQFHGFIATTHDALLIFEATRRGIIPKTNRRLSDRERHLIQSGAVFVYDEKESGIKRWTEGLLWSPSRILGNFLVYRETDKPRRGSASTPSTPTSAIFDSLGSSSQSSTASTNNPSHDSTFSDLSLLEYLKTGASSQPGLRRQSSGSASKANSISSSASTSRRTSAILPSDEISSSFSVDAGNGSVFSNVFEEHDSNPPRDLKIKVQVKTEFTFPEEAEDSQVNVEVERRLVGSLTKSENFRPGGLVKKTISVPINGTIQHLVSYYSIKDVVSGRLRTPSSLPEMAALTISPDYLIRSNFRIPIASERDEHGILHYRGEMSTDVSRNPTWTSGPSASTSRKARSINSITPGELQQHEARSSVPAQRYRLSASPQLVPKPSPSRYAPYMPAGNPSYVSNSLPKGFGREEYQNKSSENCPPVFQSESITDLFSDNGSVSYNSREVYDNKLSLPALESSHYNTEPSLKYAMQFPNHDSLNMQTFQSVPAFSGSQSGGISHDYMSMYPRDHLSHSSTSQPNFLLSLHSPRAIRELNSDLLEAPESWENSMNLNVASSSTSVNQLSSSMANFGGSNNYRESGKSNFPIVTSNVNPRSTHQILGPLQSPQIQEISRQNNGSGPANFYDTNHVDLLSLSTPNLEILRGSGRGSSDLIGHMNESLAFRGNLNSPPNFGSWPYTTQGVWSQENQQSRL